MDSGILDTAQATSFDALIASQSGKVPPTPPPQDDESQIQVTMVTKAPCSKCDHPITITERNLRYARSGKLMCSRCRKKESSERALSKKDRSSEKAPQPEQRDAPTREIEPSVERPHAQQTGKRNPLSDFFSRCIEGGNPEHIAKILHELGKM